MNHDHDLIRNVRDAELEWRDYRIEMDRLRAENERLRAEMKRALDHYDARSELYTNDADLAEGMASILRRYRDALP